VHAAWLAHDGYRVRLIDISPRHVEKANAELGALGVVAELADARHLGSVADSSYDAVRLFGPLYHLPARDDRLAALREATRAPRPGGTVAVAAVSRFASLFDGLAREFLFDPDFAAVARQDLANGRRRNPQERPHWWTTAFLHHPDQLNAEVIEAGLNVRELVGLEGLAGYLSNLAARWEDPADRETIL